MAKKIKLIISIFSVLATVALANFVMAADFGVNQVNNTVSLATADPRVIVARVIQIALSLLGVIALVLIMYAGYTWMTSDGDAEKIKNAQAILRNAVIGLIIILSAWAITTFILSKLVDAIGGGGNDTGGFGSGSFSSPGVSAIGACSVNSFYPENGQTDVPRNTSIMPLQ